jgi:pimeloyl-ACP methyl ester carboxylesterase
MCKIFAKSSFAYNISSWNYGVDLRLSEERRQLLGQKHNIAWRPDSLGALNIKESANDTPRGRQLRLDPLETTVDIYEAGGDSKIVGDERNKNVQLDKGFYSPLLASDPVMSINPRTATQKARERGWGEVFYASYGSLLQHLESRLNNTFEQGNLRKEWNDVVGIDPVSWGADSSLPQKALTEEELKKIATGCWFPGYAFGYNWLQSNGDSAHIIARRITRVMDELCKLNYECNQVIVVTHSMGGLVGRALIHPKYGNLKEKVLGIVHGVMPAIGAPATYKRMRAGFEDPGVISGAKESVIAKVLGNYGDEVTAVLANSPGGMELLPTEAYGNGWLRVSHNGRDLDAWPKNGDPYNEIYKIQNKWYALFRENWINPSGLRLRDGGGTFARTCEYLDKVQEFHRSISKIYHPNSYAHYGADSKRHSFSEVVWEIENCSNSTGWQKWSIITDTKQGKLELLRPPVELGSQVSQIDDFSDPKQKSTYGAIRMPEAPGDQTVPAKSADDQLNSQMFRGIFRQSGYEHQSSYKDPRAIASTLFSIVQIAKNATWKCK